MSYIIGHRGASFDAPENTLAAFRLAFDQGAEGVEGDFRLSADGELVCLHDADTQRVAGQKLVVKESRLVELRALDVGLWKGEPWRGERVATLEDVIAVVPEEKKLVIELKVGPEIVLPLKSVLSKQLIEPTNVLIISFIGATISACRHELSDVACHWLSGYKRGNDGHWQPGADEVIASICRLGAGGFGSQALPEHFDEAFVEKLRAAGSEEFHVWTVDNPTVAKFYAGLGAWGLTTNRPDILRRELGK